MKMHKSLKVILPIVALSMTLTGCVTPYDTPEFVTIEPNQTAFVIPLEGATSDQAKFESVELLKKYQVATKRIQIPHKWVQTGRGYWQGEWVPTVRTVVVDRYPQTREWQTSDQNTQGFTSESKDRIKFTLGITATAQILEGEDTAIFLYQYAGRKLEDVMDSEIRNKIGTTLVEKHGTMSIEEIGNSKDKVIEYVRQVVEPYFKERGITLSNIGYIGDLKYVDPKVQEAINSKFTAQQNQEAKLIENQTMINAAKAEAQRAKEEVNKAQAESQAVQIRMSTIDAQIKLKQLDNQAELIKVLPQIDLPRVMTGGSNQILQLPESLLQK